MAGPLAAAAVQHPALGRQPAGAGCACRWRTTRPAAAATAAAARPAATGRARSLRRTLAPQAAAAAEAGAAAGSGSQPQGLAAAKARLLYACGDVSRGATASRLDRGKVEEAQVAVEGYGAERELDFEQLRGRWLLRYTTARDVLPLVAPRRLPAPLEVGRIWQRFSGVEEGRVQNLIEALLPGGLPLAGGGGATLVVEAGWEVRTARSIALTFREAGVEDVRLGEGLRALLTSPILPRGWWNQRALLAVKELSLRVPLTSRLPGSTSEQRRPVGLNYMLTYLDEDMLIGRAQGGGGVFVFTRDDEAEAEQQGWHEQ